MKRRREVLTFGAHISEEEDGGKPSNLGLESDASTRPRLILVLVLLPEDLPSLVPECNGQAHQLNDRNANLSKEKI